MSGFEGKRRVRAALLQLLQTRIELLPLYRDYCSWAGHTAGGAEGEPFTRTHQAKETQGHFQPFTPKEALSFPFLSGKCPRGVDPGSPHHKGQSAALRTCRPQGPLGHSARPPPLPASLARPRGAHRSGPRGSWEASPLLTLPAGMQAWWLDGCSPHVLALDFTLVICP